ncbi:MAG: hypothetical protein WC829_23430 [Hyphomicrobium sp.]|jgi:hypothetical protein
MEVLFGLMVASLVGWGIGRRSRCHDDARALQNLMEMRSLVRAICLEDDDKSAIGRHEAEWERLTQLVWRPIP